MRFTVITLRAAERDYNDYRLLFQPEARTGAGIYETTCRRYDALCRFFAGHGADQPVADRRCCTSFPTRK